MYWCHFINLAQPPNKGDDYLRKAVRQVYQPLLDLFESNPSAHLTANIDGDLAKRLDALGEASVLERFAVLSASGRIELTASAYGSPVLGVLDAGEMERLIDKNTDVNKRLLGDAFDPKGFFPPEMSYDYPMVPVVRKLGYQWILMDEMSHTGKPGTLEPDRLYAFDNAPEVKLVFRDRSRSTGIIYGSFKTARDFTASLEGQPSNGTYVLTGTEADLYGMRRTGPRDFLEDMIKQAPCEMLTVSELLEKITKVEPATPVPASWSSWDTLAF